ncbi:MAG TPA: uracil-DNA glycosylase [Thermoanaerobaculia bacterium]|nr:uracil-DNA glycosylase [Thermoanaerobaculia bacterium]
MTPPPSAVRALAALEREVIACRRCPRLVSWRETAARHPPRRFRGQEYWARPLPAFGDPAARVLLVGLAPAAHGGNRTGRIFTGDESGNFLFRALFAVGFSNRPESIRAGDGLSLTGALVTAACRCAPPGNHPLPREFDNCRGYLVREIALLPEGAVIVALGGLAFAACLKALAENGRTLPRPRPRFAHGARYRIGKQILIGCYHPSQQNTFTGKLTQAMLRQVLRRTRKEALSVTS